jgi:hypothetical protein
MTHYLKEYALPRGFRAIIHDRRVADAETEAAVDKAADNFDLVSEHCAAGCGVSFEEDVWLSPQVAIVVDLISDQTTLSICICICICICNCHSCADRPRLVYDGIAKAAIDRDDLLNEFRDAAAK